MVLKEGKICPCTRNLRTSGKRANKALRTIWDDLVHAGSCCQELAMKVIPSARWQQRIFFACVASAYSFSIIHYSLLLLLSREEDYFYSNLTRTTRIMTCQRMESCDFLLPWMIKVASNWKDINNGEHGDSWAEVVLTDYDILTSMSIRLCGS